MATPDSPKPILDFLFDDKFRNLINRDYDELKQLDPKNSPKSVLVLSGSIIEGLLSDAILAAGNVTLSKVNGMSFEKVISEAKNLGVVSKTELSTILRSYRNLVHPAREIIDHVEFDDADATLARSAVEVLIREVRRWAKYCRALQSAIPAELEFLNLFQQTPPNSAFEHPWLRAGIYESHYGLEKKEIIITEPIVKKAGNSTQKVSILSEAVRYVEAIIFKQEPTRLSLTLNLRNIASNMASGSGATGSSR